MRKIAVCAVLSAVAWGLSAMPTRSELKGVQSTVNELTAADLSARKSGKQTSEGAARKAEELARQATDEASKFLLLKGAFGLYVEGGKYDAALRALEELKAEVKDVPDKVMADIVRVKMKKIKRSDGGAIFAYYAQLDRRLRYAAVQERAAKALRANSSDKEAHGRLALSQAVLGDWKGALDEFALAGGDLAKAAAAEKSGGASAADAWWQCAAAAGDDDLQDELKAHAAALYSQLIRDGKLDGLKKALAEKRVVETTGRAVDSLEGAGIAVRNESARNGKVTPSKPVVVGKSAGTYDWSVPRDPKKAKPVAFKMENGHVIEFISCPAGTFKMSNCTTVTAKGEALFQYADDGWHTVELTKPFWMAKYDVTLRDFTEFQSGFMDGLPPQVRASLEDPSYLIAMTMNHLDAHDFMEFLNYKYGSLLPTGYVFRLPTEAEYERAVMLGEAGFFSKARWASGKERNDRPSFVAPSWRRFRRFVKADLEAHATKWGFVGLCTEGTRLMLDSIGESVLGNEVEDTPGYGTRVKRTKVAEYFSYKQKEIDPFRTAKEGEKAYMLLRNPICRDLLPKRGSGQVRLVIGPDLVKARAGT